MPTQLEQKYLIALSLLTLSACGEKPSEPPPTPAEPPSVQQAEPAAPATPPPSLELPAIPQGAKVWFIEPTDGAKVQGPAEGGKVAVDVKMGALSIAVKPAGLVEAGSGHHHILVDTTPDAQGVVVAQDEHHLHFGKGQTEAKLALTPGEHTLRLQFADGIHRSYGPSLAAAITITIVEGAASAAAAPAAKAAPEHAAQPAQPSHTAHDTTHKH